MIFLFKAILYILINNENTSGKHFVSLSQEILPFGHEGSSPSFLCVPSRPHLPPKTLSQGTGGNHDEKCEGQILPSDF